MEAMLEYISLLPDWIQFILFLLVILGPPTGIASGVFSFLNRHQTNVAKERAAQAEAKSEMLEMRMARVRSDVDQQKANTDNLRELIDLQKQSNETHRLSDARWQQIIDRKSEREHAMDERQLAAFDQFTKAVNEQKAQTEILAMQLGNVKASTDATRNTAAVIRQDLATIQAALATLTSRLDAVLAPFEKSSLVTVDSKEFKAIDQAIRHLTGMTAEILGRLDKTQPLPNVLEEKEEQTHGN